MTDYMSLLRTKTGNHVVSELPKLPKAPFGSKDSARTKTFPKNEPANGGQVTEPTDAEREAIEYAERVAAIRSRGDVPASYTSATFCEGCGPVHIFQGAPPHVTACPWCSNRVRGLPIPRPPVSCATCALWRPDPGEREALVSCEHAKARYPHEGRGCGYWRPLS